MSGMILHFFAWWRDELLSFVPAQPRRLFQAQRNMVLVEMRSGRLFLKQVQGVRTSALGEVGLSDTPAEAQRQAVQRVLGRLPGKPSVIALDLSADQVLSRPLTFPAAAAENLHQVARYEMERRTPFTADEVYYNVELVDRTPDGERINVKLHVVPRESVDEAIGAAAALGLKPDLVGAATETLSAATGVNFLPTTAAPRGARLGAIAAAALALVTLALLAGAIALPLEFKRTRSAQLIEQVAALRKEAAVASRLSAEIDRLGKRNRFIAERKGSRPATITVLDDLTKLLPDDTWLFQMRLKDDQVSVQGYADAGSALVELIESSPRFRNVAVKSRLTRDQRTGLERFHITFELAVGGG